MESTSSFAETLLLSDPFWRENCQIQSLLLGRYQADGGCLEHLVLDIVRLHTSGFYQEHYLTLETISNEDLVDCVSTCGETLTKQDIEKILRQLKRRGVKVVTLP